VTSYAVTARIQPVSPHLRDRAWSIVTMPSADVDQPAVIVDATDQGGRALPSWGDLTRAVSETMFFMLDPESWR
jgi:type IV secretory pathway protease TraF